MIQHDLFEMEGGQPAGVELIGQMQDQFPLSGDVPDDADLDPGARLRTEALEAVGFVCTQGAVLHRGAYGLIARAASGGESGIGRLPVQPSKSNVKMGLEFYGNIVKQKAQTVKLQFELRPSTRMIAMIK